MKKTIEADKGIDILSVVDTIENDALEMLNKKFENVNGTLKSNIKVTLIIEAN